MGTLPPPTEYFPGIIFNEAYYKAANFIVTKEYIDNNFLKSVGYAYSRAIFTNFSGLVYAIGGISTSDITATGTITAAFFTGSGANLTNLNASNISTGTLTVSRGGTGLNTIPLGSLLIGNGANTLLQTTNLSWDNTNSILNATNFSGSHSGSGAGLINLNVSNANAGTLPIGRGGTGATTFISGRLLYGDGVNPLAQSANLTWNNTNNTLNTTNVNSSAYFINGSPFTPYTDANTRTVVASSAGQGLAWNITTNKLDATYSYTLPTASTSVLGGVKIDNTTIAINASGTISLSGNEILLKGGTNNMYYGWAGSDSMLGRAGTNLGYFVGVAVDDIVLRSAGRLVLMTGTTTPALVINSGNVGIGKTNPSEKLHCAGSILAGINIYADNEWSRLGIGINPSTSSGNVVHLHRALTNTEVKIQLTDSTTGIGTTDGLVIYKGTDQNGYLWNYENNALIFGTNNTEKMRILADGNVGIGVTNPTALLEVVKTHASASTMDLLNMRFDNNWGLKLQQNYSGAGNIQYDFIHRYNTTNYNVLTFRGGNVGIANTAPIAPLTIGNSSLANNDGFIVLEKCTTLGSTRQFRIGLNANFDLTLGDYGGNNVAGTWLQPLQISYQAPSQALVIESTGSVRMGFLTGGAVVNTVGLKVYASTSDGTNAIFKHPNDTQGIGIKYDGIYGTNTNQNLQLTTSGTGQIYFNTNGAERMRVYTDGSIRTPAGGAFIATACFARGGGFDIRTGCFSTGMFIEMGNEGSFAGQYLRLGAYGGLSYFESSQGRAIYFKIWAGILSGTAPTWSFQPSYDCFNANNSTSWNQASDQRIKENIVKADLKTCYDNIKNINLYRYKFIDAFDNGFRDKNKLGYIAQEVKKYFPKATYRDKKRLNDNREIPDLLSIDVEQINASLYGAVKQLIKVVEKQNKRIKTLETLLNIENNDDVEDDAGQPYERIYDENEINIDDIEPSEPSNEV